MKVLVVDDRASVRRVLVRALKFSGAKECVEAEDGVDALEKLDAVGFDLVVTDWDMPVMNGIEFVRALRSRRDGRDLAVLMVTSRAAPEEIKEALLAGADGFLAKPFKLEEFREKLEEVLSI